jgi:hypothetical protein
LKANSIPFVGVLVCCYWFSSVVIVVVAGGGGGDEQKKKMRWSTPVVRAILCHLPTDTWPTTLACINAVWRTALRTLFSELSLRERCDLVMLWFTKRRDLKHTLVRAAQLDHLRAFKYFLGIPCRAGDIETPHPLGSAYGPHVMAALNNDTNARMNMCNFTAWANDILVAAVDRDSSYVMRYLDRHHKSTIIYAFLSTRARFERYAVLAIKKRRLKSVKLVVSWFRDAHADHLRSLNLTGRNNASVVDPDRCHYQCETGRLNCLTMAIRVGSTDILRFLCTAFGVDAFMTDRDAMALQFVRACLSYHGDVSMWKAIVEIMHVTRRDVFGHLLPGQTSVSDELSKCLDHPRGPDIIHYLLHELPRKRNASNGAWDCDNDHGNGSESDVDFCNASIRKLFRDAVPACLEHVLLNTLPAKTHLYDTVQYLLDEGHLTRTMCNCTIVASPIWKRVITHDAGDMDVLVRILAPSETMSDAEQTSLMDTLVQNSIEKFVFDVYFNALERLFDHLMQRRAAVESASLYAWARTPSQHNCAMRWLATAVHSNCTRSVRTLLTHPFVAFNRDTWLPLSTRALPSAVECAVLKAGWISDEMSELLVTHLGFPIRHATYVL